SASNFTSVARFRSPEDRLSDSLTRTSGSALDKGLFIDIAAGLAAAALFEAARIEQRQHIREHARSATDQNTIQCRVERRQAEIISQFSRRKQRRDTTVMPERLAGDGRIIAQLLAHQLADKLILRQSLLDHLGISEIGNPAATVHEHERFKSLVDL